MEHMGIKERETTSGLIQRPFPQEQVSSYVYTNSGEEGKWEGLDVPYIRSFTVEAKNGEKKLYRPIESFGRIYMQADPWHTNAVGYELIARALLATLKKNEQVKDYLRQAKSKPLTSSHDR